jgi:hypothetical protein
MAELLEVAGGLAISVALIVLLGWALYFAFGPQVLGLPAMLGLFVVIAGARVVGNVGLAGVLVIGVALVAVVVIIGMAMSVGSERSRSPRDESEY